VEDSLHGGEYSAAQVLLFRPMGKIHGTGNGTGEGESRGPLPRKRDERKSRFKGVPLKKNLLCAGRGRLTEMKHICLWKLGLDLGGAGGGRPVRGLPESWKVQSGREWQITVSQQDGGKVDRQKPV